MIDVTIDAASIDTREAKRDDHLRGKDFLDVATHPTLTFKSKKIAPAGSSPAIREAGRQALGAAGIGIERIEHLDVYSCFPAAVQIGCDALGISADDPRPLTVTGGLPYFGGPGNNYSTHAIAEVMQRVRARPGSIGLVTALGWFITKHAVGIYGAVPKDGPFVRADPAPRQAILDAQPAPPLALEPDGPASIETYTVLHDRDGASVRGLVIGRLDDGRRFLADTPADRATLDGLMTTEGVGRRGRASTVDGAGRFRAGVTARRGANRLASRTASD